MRGFQLGIRRSDPIKTESDFTKNEGDVGNYFVGGAQ